MKYLYVLVSNSTDFYSEQAFLSIYSLKLKTPNAFVSLLVDNHTAEYLEKKFQELIKSVNEFKVIELDKEYSNKEKSRILKTTMRQQIDGDFLFIDCDTVICDDLSEIEKCQLDIACVLDSHVPVSIHWGKIWMMKNYKKCGFTESINKPTHFNSGVIYCKDNPITRKFFADWACLMQQSVKAGIYIDQPSFNQADIINGSLIKELTGEWNCQLVQGGVKYLCNAKIIHYFASQKNFRSPYLLADKKILDDIRVQRKITDKIMSFFLNPKAAISEQSRLLSPDIPIELFFHQPFSELVYIYRNQTFVYKILRFICFLSSKLHK